MHKTSNIVNLDGLMALSKMVLSRETPSHEAYENQRRIEPLSMMQHPGADQLESLIEECALTTQPGGTQKSYAARNVYHWRQIFYNFIRSIATNQWLGIPGDTHAYAKGSYYNEMGLSRSGVSKVLESLVKRGWVLRVTGKKYSHRPRVNHYYPSEAMKRLLVDYALFTDSPKSFGGPFLSINDPDPEYLGFRWLEGHEDRCALEQINDFAREQTWACRGAIKQSFKHTPFQSGRLITPFQNLHARKYPIRINTLINGNPVSEVDFNGNHLRLFLAFHGCDPVGDKDVYEAISSESGTSRDDVKRFINIALNTSSLRGAMTAADLNFGLDRDRSAAIDMAFNRIYPKLSLYCGFALTAMQLEGLILKRVLLRGVDNGVFCLPVHDAVAVQAKDEDWVVDVMLDAWAYEMSMFKRGSRTHLKVSRPNLG